MNIEEVMNKSFFAVFPHSGGKINWDTLRKRCFSVFLAYGELEQKMACFKTLNKIQGSRKSWENTENLEDNEEEHMVDPNAGEDDTNEILGSS